MDGDGVISFKERIFFVYNNLLALIGWDDHQTKYKTIALALSWAAVGTTYGLLYEKWDIRIALLYSIGGMAAAGQLPPPCIPSDSSDVSDSLCQLGQFRGYFTAMYLMVGVPLFAYTLGQFSGLVVERAIQASERKHLLTPLSPEEYSFAATLNSSRNNGSSKYEAKLSDTRLTSTTPDSVADLDSNSICFAEFVVMEMLRLKRFSTDEVDDLRRIFDTIDSEGTGTIDKEHLLKSHMYFSTDNVASAQSPETTSLLSNIASLTTKDAPNQETQENDHISNLSVEATLIGKDRGGTRKKK